MTNIKQITNYDLVGADTTSHTIQKAGETISWNYYIVPSSLLEHSFSKMGYCCEPMGIAYPIFLQIEGSSGGLQEFQIGKTGMFEFQKEKWKDVNSEVDPEEHTAEVVCLAVHVPTGIKFTLDYCYEI